MTTANDPNWWLGALAMSIGQHATGRTTDQQLKRDYEQFLRSPIVKDDPDLAAILPPSRRKDHA